jgi:hypothetical protein
MLRTREEGVEKNEYPCGASSCTDIHFFPRLLPMLRKLGQEDNR